MRKIHPHCAVNCPLSKPTFGSKCHLQTCLAGLKVVRSLRRMREAATLIRRRGSFCHTDGKAAVSKLYSPGIGMMESTTDVPRG